MANYAHGRSPTKTRCRPAISEVNKQLTAPKPCTQPARAAFNHTVNIDFVKSHPTLTPGFASNDDPSDGAETGVAELHIAEQSRSWRAAIGERKIMRGS